MANYRVVVSTERPTTIDAGFDLDHSPHRQCGTFPGTPVSGGPNDVICQDDTVGRYVYVYLPTKGILYICELEVFGFRKWELSIYASVFDVFIYVNIYIYIYIYIYMRKQTNDH